MFVREAERRGNVMTLLRVQSAVYALGIVFICVLDKGHSRRFTYNRSEIEREKEDTAGRCCYRAAWKRGDEYRETHGSATTFSPHTSVSSHYKLEI